MRGAILEWATLTGSDHNRGLNIEATDKGNATIFHFGRPIIHIEGANPEQPHRLYLSRPHNQSQGPLTWEQIREKLKGAKNYG